QQRGASSRRFPARKRGPDRFIAERIDAREMHRDRIAGARAGHVSGAGECEVRIVDDLRQPHYFVTCAVCLVCVAISRTSRFCTASLMMPASSSTPDVPNTCPCTLTCM